MSWPIVKLNEIADVVRGVTFSKDDATDDANGTIPILRAGNIQDTLILSDDLVYLPPEFVSAKQLLQAGDIVMCMSSGSANVLGKSGLLQMPWHCSFGAFLAVIRAVPGKVDASYLSHFFRHPLFRSWASSSNGIGIKNIRLSDLADIEIPLPPLEEQKRIAGILDQADALRRLRARALEKLNTLGQAVFQEMFGAKKTNLHERVTLGSLIKVSSGKGLTASAMDGGDFPVYGGNGVNGWHSEGFVAPETIVIGRVGAYCGAVHLIELVSWVTDNALIVTNLKEINTAYLYYALQNLNLNQYAGRAAQPLISGSRIYPLEVSVPDITEQKRFENTLKTYRPQLALQADANSLSETMFASLQSAAFQGKL